MKVLLANPSGTEYTFTGSTSPPLGLLYLVSELRKYKIEVDFIDGCIAGKKHALNYIKESKPDIIGFPCLTPERHAVWDFLAETKKISDAKIVVGGAHPTSLPNQVLENYPVDEVCTGEGEKWLSHYALTGDNKPSQYENLDDIEFPAWF